MNTFKKWTILAFILLTVSCASVKKEAAKPVKDDTAKQSENGTTKVPSADKSVHSYFTSAEKIVKSGKKENFGKAREDLMFVIKNINPDKDTFNVSDAYRLLGILNTKDGRYSEAIDAYEMMPQRERDKTGNINAIGYAYLMLKKYDKAVEYFEKSLQKEANNFSALMNLGMIYYMQNDYEKAVQYYINAGGARISDYRPMYNAAEIYYLLGKMEEAKDHYKKAIERNDSALIAKTNLSYLLLNEKKYKDASLILKEGKSPSVYDNFYINLAISQRAEGKIKDAEGSYLKVLEINPSSPVALKNLGILYDVYMGKRELALKYYEKYVEIGGKDKEKVLKWIKIIKGSGAKREQ